MSWLLFALASPLFFGIANIFDKLISGRHLHPTSFVISSGLVYFFPIFLLPFADLSISAFAAIAAMMAGLLSLSAGLFYFKAVAIEEASRVAPLWNLQALFTLFLSFLVLGEVLTLRSYTGFVLIVTASFLLTAKNLRRILLPNKVFALMAGATSISAVFIVMIKMLTPTNPFWTIQILFFVGGSMNAFALLAIPKTRKTFVSDAKSLTKPALMKFAGRQSSILAAFVLLNLAVLNGSPSLTAALAGMTGFYVFIFATLFSIFSPHILSEAIDRKTLLTKAAAITTIVTGLFVINGSV